MWSDFLFRLEVWHRKVRSAMRRRNLIRRALGLDIAPGAGPNSPGLLLLQIDGFSYRQFERALSRNQMPFLASLLKREGYRLEPFYSGLPSSTPAVQAELYYGVRGGVPAFGFLDRQRKRFVLMYNPQAARDIEEELRRRGGEPLLKNGSSWMNVFSGGASPHETHFCSVTYGIRHMFRAAAIARLLVVIVLHFPSILRILFFTLGELVLGLWDMIRAVAGGDRFLKELEFIVSRVIVAAGLREFLILGGAIDLNRGIPIVHVNFLGYDERSHRRGPSTRFAHGELHRIDRALKQLYQAAESSNRRDYQIWIFSDHGQENVRSFEEEYPGGIGQVVFEALKEFDREMPGGRVFCGTELRDPWFTRKQVRKNLEDQELPDSAGPQEKESYTVVARGPVGHLYLSSALSTDQKRSLAGILVSKGVPGVVFLSEPGRATWVHEGGQVHLPDGAEHFLPHPPAVRKELGADIVRLCQNKNAGDLVLLGWHPEKQPWTFPLERGAHAGPGLDETRGFLLLPAGSRLPVPAQDFVRPSVLREAILHALGRVPLPASVPARTISRRTTIRLATYNVHACIGLDGRVSRARILRILRGLDPDVIALQELDIHRMRTGRENQAEEIAKELQMSYEFCTTVSSGEESYGHALLSRFPITPLACGCMKARSPRVSAEPRGAILARLELENQQIYVMNTHLGLRSAERLAQIEELLGPNWAGQVPSGMPLVVCGDFNMVPGSVPYRRIASVLKDTGVPENGAHPMRTFVSAYPFTRIDYVFCNEKFRVQSARAPRNSLTRIASDHLPVMVELELLKS